MIISEWHTKQNCPWGYPISSVEVAYVTSESRRICLDGHCFPVTGKIVKGQSYYVEVGDNGSFRDSEAEALALAEQLLEGRG